MRPTNVTLTSTTGSVLSGPGVESMCKELHLPVVDSSVRDAVETAKIVLLLSPLIKDRSTEPRDLSLLLFLSDEKEQEFI